MSVIDFLTTMSIARHSCVAVVGSGGKSTLIRQIAREALAADWPVIITTTTHIQLPFFHPEENVMVVDAGITPELIATKSSARPLLLIGKRLAQRKVTGITAGLLRDLLGKYLLLVEADGSRRKPFKIPAAWEPVIPDISTHTIIVVGSSVARQPGDRGVGTSPGITAATLADSDGIQRVGGESG